MPQNPPFYSEADPILPSGHDSAGIGTNDYGSRDHDYPSDPQPSSQSCQKRYLGLLLAFLSGILLTTFSALLKLVKMDPMEVVIIRGVLQSLIMACVAIYKKQSFKGEIKAMKIMKC